MLSSCACLPLPPCLPLTTIAVCCTVLQGLVGVLEAAEAACGRREALPQLLEGCIAASVEAAFDASLAQLSANVSAGE